MGMHHATQSMYSNLIPAYYIPPHVSASQKPTGGYFVSVPTILSQQPLQLVPGIYNNFSPMESPHSMGASILEQPLKSELDMEAKCKIIGGICQIFQVSCSFLLLLD